MDEKHIIVRRREFVDAPSNKTLDERGERQTARNQASRGVQRRIRRVEESEMNLPFIPATRACNNPRRLRSA